MIVLYAEDDIEDFNIFCDVVESFNPSIKVVNARDGAQALEMLESMPVLPHMIFLDINMPTMDGKSCLKSIKNDKRLDGIPVIVYTTTTSRRDKDLCTQLGASEFIMKPTSLKEAVSVLSEVLAKGFAKY